MWRITLNPRIDDVRLSVSETTWVFYFYADSSIIARFLCLRTKPGMGTVLKKKCAKTLHPEYRDGLGTKVFGNIIGIFISNEINIRL